VIVYDIVGIAGKAPLVRAGQVNEVSVQVSCQNIPDISQSPIRDCRVADAEKKKDHLNLQALMAFAAFFPASRPRTDGARRTIRLQRRRRIAGTTNDFFTALSRSRPTKMLVLATVENTMAGGTDECQAETHAIQMP